MKKGTRFLAVLLAASCISAAVLPQKSMLQQELLLKIALLFSFDSLHS